MKRYPCPLCEAMVFHSKDQLAEHLAAHAGLMASLTYSLDRLEHAEMALRGALDDRQRLVDDDAIDFTAARRQG